MYEGYIFGKEYFREAIPDMKSIAGAKTYRLKQGAGNDIEVVELYTGTGFSVSIYPERGMDIGEAYYCGLPLAFMSKAGVKNPKNINQSDFSRYFFAGMLTTCGLDNVGEACKIENDFYPGHGRLNLTPAEEYNIKKGWEGNEYVIELTGAVRIAALFGENLLLKRSIKVKAGESKIYLKDEIINDGYVKERYMLLYHCNFGYPIVSDDSKIYTNHKVVEYLDLQSEKSARKYDKITKPEPGFLQSAYVLSEPQGNKVKAAIINDNIEIGVYLETKHNQLDKFCEWMNLASQDYVIGLEPAKSLPNGRKKAMEDNSINWIDSKESHIVELEIGVLTRNEIAKYKAEL